MESHESPDYQQEMSNLETMLDALPLAERGVVMQRLRDAMTSGGEQLSAEDENLFDQFSQGAIDIRQVQEHFGDRLWRAFGARPDPDEVPGRSTDAPAADPEP
jgi:hypothetical protein